MPRGVILDVDGTLLLSNDAHARAWAQACAEYGYEVPFERVRPLIGMGGDRLIAIVAPGLDVRHDPGAAIAARRKEIVLARYLSVLEPAPGARALVAHMRAAGLRLVVASSAKPDELDALLGAARVRDLLAGTTALGDVDASKPAPDPVAAALEQIGPDPTAALMLGDAPYDVEAAAGAGGRTIALRCGGFADADLAGAVAIYDDPADLLARYDDSPLAASGRLSGTGSAG